MDLQFLDHVPHVPLDSVRRDAEMARHSDCVQSLAQQVQDVQLSGRESGNSLLAVLFFCQYGPLPQHSFCEQRNREEPRAGAAKSVADHESLNVHKHLLALRQFPGPRSPWLGDEERLR